MGELSQLIEDDPFAPLPQVVSTERPDRAVSFLLEGQAVILIDGSPRCLAMPVSLWHLFHAPDDSYMRWMYGTFMRVVRAVGAVLALLLPAAFVSMVIFHPLALPMSLLTNIIQSRSIVSISLFGEAVLMLTVFDLINEARVESGLHELTVNEEAMELAKIRVPELEELYSHTRPDGSRISRTYAYGEIINRRASTPEIAVSSWLDSPGHRDMILAERYHSAGIACWQGSDGITYWCMLFCR